MLRQFSVFTIESMIRTLAWCGMKTSRSSGLIPAASSACCATFAISNTAQRKTAWPSCVIAGNLTLPALSRGSSERSPIRKRSHGTVCLIVSALSPPNPTPWADRRLLRGADHDRAGAVTEQEGRGPVLQVGQVAQPLHADDQHVLRRTLDDHALGEGQSVAEAGTARRDVEGGGLVRAQSVGDLGRHRRVWLKCDTVETTTAPICSASIPASAIALPEASTDIAATVSSGDAQCRVSMPERDRIHSSDESIVSRITSLGTTRVGR